MGRQRWHRTVKDSHWHYTTKDLDAGTVLLRTQTLALYCQGPNKNPICLWKDLLLNAQVKASVIAEYQVY